MWPQIVSYLPSPWNTCLWNQMKERPALQHLGFLAMLKLFEGKRASSTSRSPKNAAYKTRNYIFQDRMERSWSRKCGSLTTNAFLMLFGRKNSKKSWRAVRPRLVFTCFFLPNKYLNISLNIHLLVASFRVILLCFYFLQFLLKFVGWDPHKQVWRSWVTLSNMRAKDRTRYVVDSCI